MILKWTTLLIAVEEALLQVSNLTDQSHHVLLYKKIIFNLNWPELFATRWSTMLNILTISRNILSPNLVFHSNLAYRDCPPVKKIGQISEIINN